MSARRTPASPRVIGLGLCVVDQLLVVDSFDLSLPRLRYHAVCTAPGGMVTTALAQAAALGCRTQLLSRVGADEAGRSLRRQLRDLGVGTRYLLHSARRPTGLAVVLVRRRDGERRFLVAERRAQERGGRAFDLAPLRPGSLLLVDGHFPAQALRAVKHARRVGARVVADLHRASSDRLRLLRWVDHAVVSREFCTDLGREPRDALRWLAERSRGVPVVTLGHAGGLYLEAERIRRFRAPRVRAVDTTGAGDAFHGAFAAALAWNRPLEAALEIASRAAALNCTALGGQGRLLRQDEL